MVNRYIVGPIGQMYMEDVYKRQALAHVDKTFTVGFADKQYDETDYAREFSAHILSLIHI